MPNFTSGFPRWCYKHEPKSLPFWSVTLPSLSPRAGATGRAERESLPSPGPRANLPRSPRGSPVPSGLQGARGGGAEQVHARAGPSQARGAPSASRARLQRGTQGPSHPPPHPRRVPEARTPRTPRGLQGPSHPPAAAGSPDPAPPTPPAPPRRAALTYLCTSVRTRLQSMAPPAAPAALSAPAPGSARPWARARVRPRAPDPVTAWARRAEREAAAAPPRSCPARPGVAARGPGWRLGALGAGGGLRAGSEEARAGSEEARTVCSSPAPAAPLLRSAPLGSSSPRSAPLGAPAPPLPPLPPARRPSRPCLRPPGPGERVTRASEHAPRGPRPAPPPPRARARPWPALRVPVPGPPPGRGLPEGPGAEAGGGRPEAGGRRAGTTPCCFRLPGPALRPGRGDRAPWGASDPRPGSPPHPVPPPPFPHAPKLLSPSGRPDGGAGPTSRACVAPWCWARRHAWPLLVCRCHTGPSRASGGCPASLSFCALG